MHEPVQLVRQVNADAAVDVADLLVNVVELAGLLAGLVLAIGAAVLAEVMVADDVVLVVVLVFHLAAGGALGHVLAVADAQVMAETLVPAVDVLVPAHCHTIQFSKKACNGRSAAAAGA